MKDFMKVFSCLCVFSLPKGTVQRDFRRVILIFYLSFKKWFLTPRGHGRLTHRGMIPSEFFTKIENSLTRWSVTKVGSNDEKNWR